jgi:hypothetical protein
MGNKNFDAVAWMRRRREKIDEEDQGLSWDEKHIKTRKLIENDPLWLRLRDRIVKPSGSLSVALQESRGEYRPKQGK